MSKIATIGAFSLGGVTLFAVSFVMFAALSGVPLSEVAVLKEFVSEPPEEEVEALPEDEGREEIAAPEEVIEANARVTDAFVLPSPFEPEELTELQSQLKARLAGLEQMRQEQEQREQHLDRREKNLEARYAELMRIRTMLQDYETELDAQSEEVQRDAAAQKARERSSWKIFAGAFEEGELETLVERLTAYEPEEAAQILRALDKERAGELIRLLPAEKFREYADAYRKLAVD